MTPIPCSTIGFEWITLDITITGLVCACGIMWWCRSHNYTGGCHTQSTVISGPLTKAWSPNQFLSFKLTGIVCVGRRAPKVRLACASLIRFYGALLWQLMPHQSNKDHYDTTKTARRLLNVHCLHCRHKASEKPAPLRTTRDVSWSRVNQQMTNI